MRYKIKVQLFNRDLDTEEAEYRYIIIRSTTDNSCVDFKGNFYTDLYKNRYYYVIYYMLNTQTRINYLRNSFNEIETYFDKRK